MKIQKPRAGAVVCCADDMFRGTAGAGVGLQGAPPAKRAEALRYLAHFIADLHMPLHATTNSDMVAIVFR
jgi:hypothetical protein